MIYDEFVPDAAAATRLPLSHLPVRRVVGPSSQYQNPVLPGAYPDPSVVRVGEDYYLVNSTFQYFPAIVISHSRDLVHWRQIGHVFTDPGKLNLEPFSDGCGIWAPDISCHQGEFWIYYCLVQLSKDRSVNVRGNHVVKSRHILGPYSDPVQLTSEGNDPSHFVDDDSSRYLLYAGGILRGRGTKIVRLSDDGMRVVGEPRWLEWGEERAKPEGPHLFKRNGFYYHTMACQSGYHVGHHQVIARSRHLFGPYEPSPYNPFIAQHDRVLFNGHQGHAKLVQTQRGEWWAMYLSKRYLQGVAPLGRETGIDRVTWTPDGWPLLNNGNGPSDGGLVPDLPVSEHRVQAGDDFDCRELMPQWVSLRTRDAQNCNTTERPGFLRLRTSDADLDMPIVRGMLLQREPGHHYTATAHLQFAAQEGEQAGLVCYYDTQSFIKFARTGSPCGTLVVEECCAGVRNRIARATIRDATKLYLRCAVKRLSRTFSYSVDGEEFLPLTTIEDASFLSDEGTPGWGFMGTMVGLFAVHCGSNRSLTADFDSFQIQRTEDQ